MGFSERSMEMLGVMENSVRNNPDISFWKNRKVLVTGHTGFKGSWLTFWLLKMGVKVCGISLEPESEKNLFDLLNLEKNILNIIFAILGLKTKLKKLSMILNLK